ncbi:MAG: hypothetical protein D6705_13040, partial [Deltaproteobacteria bacterium]
LLAPLPATPVVNSIHHQAIDRIAPALRAVAWAEDGIVEAVEPVEDRGFVVGVQWHPEWMPPRPHEPDLVAAAPLFEAFVAAAGAYAER